jgi:hypothetical protein
LDRLGLRRKIGRFRDHRGGDVRVFCGLSEYQEVYCPLL